MNKSQWKQKKKKKKKKLKSEFYIKIIIDFKKNRPKLSMKSSKKKNKETTTPRKGNDRSKSASQKNKTATSEKPDNKNQKKSTSNSLAKITDFLKKFTIQYKGRNLKFKNHEDSIIEMEDESYASPKKPDAREKRLHELVKQSKEGNLTPETQIQFDLMQSGMLYATPVYDPS